MRIVGGRNRGLRLAELGRGDAAAHLRPTADRVRESLFDLLAASHGDPVPGARVLDLFAGTGALGLEALSRGAAAAVFVETGAKALGLIDRNIARAGGADARVLRRDATRLGPARGAPFDLVFLDPPYGAGLGARALSSAREGGWLGRGALVVWEEDAAQSPPRGFTEREVRRYGATVVTLLEAPMTP